MNMFIQAYTVEMFQPTRVIVVVTYVSRFGPTGWNKILSMGKFNQLLTWLSIELFVSFQWYCNQ